MRLASSLVALAVVACAHSAANAQPGTSPSTAMNIPPAEQQITAAVLALPKEFRDGATVLGYAGKPDKLTTLRAGKGPFICLASDPKATRFHVACYHRSLEAFMARGRELRANGVTGEKVDTVRFAEIKSGKLAMPKQAATLYQLSGKIDAFDAATGTAPTATPLFVIYISGATSESTGLSAIPVQGGPWIMFPGTPKAHIMLVPKM
ncbi:MAG: hypothetical protein M3081_19485 [Gemmatimonadota bacterium]|nr:hypothetical protein [Gemmatimonadota bacterium]